VGRERGALTGSSPAPAPMRRGRIWRSARCAPDGHRSGGVARQPRRL